MATEDCNSHKAGRNWVAEHSSLASVPLPGGGLRIDASAIFPISPDAFFRLLTHPENYRIFRNVERCTCRKVLQDDGDRQLVLVDNVTFWKFGVLKGSATTRLAVLQDSSQHTMEFTLAPGVRNGHVQSLYGRWRVESWVDSKGRTCCKGSLFQTLVPRGIPPMFISAFAKIMKNQILHSFEDLATEALRTLAGRPALPPCAASSDAHEQSSNTREDPSSVLAALEQASTASSSSEFDVESSRGSGSCDVDWQPGARYGAGKVALEDAKVGIRSHALTRWASVVSEGDLVEVAYGHVDEDGPFYDMEEDQDQEQLVREDPESWSMFDWVPWKRLCAKTSTLLGSARSTLKVAETWYYGNESTSYA
jgi:hypothetical protein